MARTAERDVVVIGAGHNGLVAANYLAAAGLDVAVVEASERIGGMTSTTATIPGAPDHLINSYAVDAFFWDAFPAARDLGLERDGLLREPIDPGHAYLHPDGVSIGSWADATRTVEEIRHFSNADARAYEELARVLRRGSGTSSRARSLRPSAPNRSVTGQGRPKVIGIEWIRFLSEDLCLTRCRRKRASSRSSRTRGSGSQIAGTRSRWESVARTSESILWVLQASGASVELSATET